MALTDPHIEYRLKKVEDQAKELDTLKNKLSESILLLGIRIENGLIDLSNRIKHFEERKQFWNKVIGGILIALAVAAITQVFRISYIVQANRFPGGT